MALKLGTWGSNYALGEKLFVATYKDSGYSDNDIGYRLLDCKNSSTMHEYQRRAEIFFELIGGSHGGGSSALFGPIDRSKENTDRMHAITLSMAADTGKHNHKPGSYNAATVPIFVLKDPDGLYVTPAGTRTANKEKALSFYSREEIKQTYPSHQAWIGWTVEEV